MSAFIHKFGPARGSGAVPPAAPVSFVRPRHDAPDYVQRIRDRLNAPKHVIVRQTVRDDLADLIDDLRKDKFTAALIFALGFMAGVLAVVVPVFVIARVIS